MATGAPPSDHPARDRHQIQTLILAATILVTAALAVLLAVTFAASLNRHGFLYFPLGFYLLAQGLLIFIVVLAFWFVRIQERIDLARGQGEGL